MSSKDETGESGETAKKRWTWVRDVALMLVVLGAVMAYQTWDHVGGGTPAPAFNLEQLDAEGHISTESLAGKPTVIYFWAPWCSVCDASSHNMNAVLDAVGDDANVLSVALEYRSIDSVRDFATRNEIRYPVLLGTSDVLQDYVVTSFPTIYVLNRDTEVTSSVVGYTTELGIRARLWWAGF